MGGASAPSAVPLAGIMHGVGVPGGGPQGWLPAAAPPPHDNRGAGASLGGGSAAVRSLKSRLVGPRPPDSAVTMAALAAATSEMMGATMSAVGVQSGMILGVDEGGAAGGGGGAGSHGLMGIDMGGRVMAHPVQIQLQQMGGGIPPAGGLGAVDGMVGPMESPGRAEQRRRR